MKTIIILFVILFNLQSFAKSDDIRDFQIGEMSVGDSLLDHFNIENIIREINSDFIYIYPGGKFLKIGVGDTKEFFLIKNIDPYDDISITIKPNDKEYIIYSIGGRIFCMSDLNDCFEKQSSISSDLKEDFGNNASFETWDKAHRADKTNQSHIYGNRFDFINSGESISINIYDWSKKMTTEKNWQDHVTVSIHSKEFYDFLAGDIKY